MDDFDIAFLLSFSKWKQIMDGSFYTDRPRANIPIVICSNESDPPSDEKVNQHLVFVNANQYANDSAIFNRPIRFIRSMEANNEPITLEEYYSGTNH